MSEFWLVQVVAGLLREWQADPQKPRRDYTSVKWPADHPERWEPLRLEEVRKYKDFLLDRAPATYARIFPEENKGLPVPGLSWFGFPPNDCVAASWHQTAAVVCSQQLYDAHQVKEPDRKGYFDFLVRIHGIAIRRAASDEEMALEVDRSIEEAAATGLDPLLLCRLADLEFVLMEKHLRIAQPRPLLISEGYIP